MAVTPLTLYGNGAASATLPSASTMWSAAGSTATRAATATVGTNTGWFEMQSGATTFTPTFGSGQAPIPSGHGFLWDVTTLEGQYFDVGNWSAHFRASVNDASTLTADLVCRFYVYHSASASSGSKYTYIGSVTLASQTITSTWVTYFLPTVQLPGVGFLTGDKLYVDWYVNIKTSTGSTGTTQLLMGDISTATGGAQGNEYITPGYQPVAASVATSAFISRSGQALQQNGKQFRYVGFNSYDLAVRDAPPAGQGAMTPALQLTRCQALRDLGVNVIRIWAFGETTAAVPPVNYFQYGPTGGQWNESAFVLLDNAIAAAKQCGIAVILCLANQWSGYHGYKGTYVQWYNAANSTSLTDDNFHDTPGIIAMYQAFIKQLVTRTNTVTGVAYAAEPAIMGYECINEGRYTTIPDSNPNTVQSSRVVQMTSWYGLISSYIKALDGSHLVSTGGIGQAADFVSGDGFHNGTYYGLDLLTMSQLPAIDLVDYHLYPVTGTEPGPGSFIFASTSQYHADLAQIGGYGATAGKPVVMNEVGDNRLVQDSTLYGWLFPRDRYYADLFAESFVTNGLAGILLWNYGADDYFGYATGDLPPAGTPLLNVPDEPVFRLVQQWNYSLNVTPTVTPQAVLLACDAVAAHIAARNLAVLPEVDRQITLNRVIASADPALFPSFTQCLYNEYAWLAGRTPVDVYSLLLDCWYNACVALDTAVGGSGLASYLQTNTLQVAWQFLDCYNRYIARKGSGTPLSNWQSFGPSGIVLSSFTDVSGYLVGASIPAAYGNAALALVVSGLLASTGLNADTYTVTYNAYSTAGVLQTGLTTTVQVPASSRVGTVFPLGVSGVAVTSIALTSGAINANDNLACVSQPLRVVTF